MAKRGVQLGGEFRYLEPSYQGQLRADVMPNDRCAAHALGLCAGAQQRHWRAGGSAGPALNLAA
jgi:LPS-assembly protein